MDSEKHRETNYTISMRAAEILNLLSECTWRSWLEQASIRGMFHLLSNFNVDFGLIFAETAMVYPNWKVKVLIHYRQRYASLEKS